jgi:pentatricopeptide repeat protein
MLPCHDLTAAITACGNAGQWQQAKHLIVQMRERGVQPNVVTYTAALNACGKVHTTSYRSLLLFTVNVTLHTELYCTRYTVLHCKGCVRIKIHVATRA